MVGTMDDAKPQRRPHRRTQGARVPRARREPWHGAAPTGTLSSALHWRIHGAPIDAPASQERAPARKEGAPEEQRPEHYGPRVNWNSKARTANGNGRMRNAVARALCVVLAVLAIELALFLRSARAFAEGRM